MEYLTSAIVPAVMALVGMGMCISKKDMYGEFISGAKDGMKSTIGLLPTLIALLCAISMFNASGASEWLAEILTPVGNKIGIPSEIIPLILVRPLSGGASTAMIADIFQKYGADSLVGRITSVIAGSSDTLLYVISVYFGAVSVKKTRATVPISLLTMIFCVFFSCFLCRIWFK